MKRRLGPPIAGLFLLHPALRQDTDCTECECKILTEMVKGRALRHLYALIWLIGVVRPRGGDRSGPLRCRRRGVGYADPELSGSVLLSGAEPEWYMLPITDR